MMKKINVTSLVLAIALTVLSFGCSHKKAAEESPLTSGQSSGAPTASEAMKEPQVLSSDMGNAFLLQTIHFPYDSSALDDANKKLLAKNAMILKESKNLQIQIEGHCDQRGGTQYNIALGERRAKAVEKLLKLQGVSADRLTTISLGKEKPLVLEESEEAYAKNRRANFVVTAH